MSEMFLFYDRDETDNWMGQMNVYYGYREI